MNRFTKEDSVQKLFRMLFETGRSCRSMKKYTKYNLSAHEMQDYIVKK